MRNEKTKLTKRVVDAVITTGKEYYVWDSEIPGFGLRITPQGSISYMYKYRNGRGRKATTRKLTIGKPPMTPDQAREKALEYHYRVAKGENPAEESRAKREDKTLREIKDVYDELYGSVYLKPSTKASNEFLWKVMLKSIGNRQIRSITKLDVERFMIEHKDTPYQANRMMSLLSKAMKLCEEWGYKPQNSNPCKGVRKFKEHARERYLTQDEIKRLFAVLNTEDENRSTSIYITNLFRLLLLTGCRLGEIKDLKWEWVNFEQNRLELPDSKTGAKFVPLNSEAVAVLNRTPPLENNPYVIASERCAGKPLHNAKDAWIRLRAKAGLDDVRIHDLRHTFASVAISYLGMSLPMVGGILGHKRSETTNRYAHLADEPLREASQLVAAVMTGNKPADPEPEEPDTEPADTPAEDIPADGKIISIDQFRQQANA